MITHQTANDSTITPIPSTDSGRAVFESVWLPKAPLAGASKQGPYRRMKRAHALSMPYIEANPTVMCSLIITDHDGGMADEISSTYLKSLIV